MSIVELQRELCPGDGKARVRFVTKIFRALSYTREHPDEISQVGAAWCSDGVHFVSNSAILAQFLNLKPNSINTNFRDHGFVITGKGEVGRDLPAGTKDATHWKKRHNREAHFTINATEQTINSINSIQDRVSAAPSAPAQFPFMPRKTAELLQIDPRQQVSLANMVYSLQGSASSEWFYRVLEKATEIWVSVVQAIGPCVELERLTGALFNDLAMDEGAKRQVLLNFEFLIQQRDDSSQLEQLIPFESFVKFMVRYGWVNGMLELLTEVSHFSSEGSSLIPGFCEFDSQTPSEKVQFKSWFFPSSDRLTAERWISKHVRECWVVIPSKTPNYFTLLYKEETGVEIVALHIIHDCLAPERSQRFSVRFKNGEHVCTSSLTEMLTGTLGLMVHDAEVVTQENKAREVAADDFVNRNRRVDEELQDPPSDLSQRPAFLQNDSQFCMSQHDTQTYNDSQFLF